MLGLASASCATGRGPRRRTTWTPAVPDGVACAVARRRGASVAWWTRSSPRRGRRSRRSPPTGASSRPTCVEREAADGQPPATGDRIPLTLSASSLMDHALCPKRFYWSRVRPLPRFSGPAARIGTEIHKWIERRAAGQGRLLEPDDVVDLTQEELAGDPGRVERLRTAFLGSRFADRAPLFAERAFLLRVGAFAVGGRIDAIYGEADGPWEVVDWKTGRGEPTRCSSSCTASRAPRSGTSGPRS